MVFGSSRTRGGPFWNPWCWPCGRGARRPTRTCGGRWKRSSGGTGTAPSGAGHPGRTRPLVGRGADVHPLGQAGRMGALARVGPSPRGRRRAVHDLRGRDQHQGARQGGGGARKRGTAASRDEREAPGRSRGGYGSEAVAVADARGRAVAFALAPGPAHEAPIAPGSLDRLPGGPMWVVGDEGFSSESLRGQAWGMGARPAIPPKRDEAPAGPMPGMGLRASRSDRAAVGQVEGVARRRDPVREDGHVPPRHTLLRRGHGLAQDPTGPSTPRSTASGR
jgi:hypothetical protein